MTYDVYGIAGISDAQVTEGNNGKVNAVFTVSLSGAINQPVTVRCDTGGWSAGSGSGGDYVARTNSIVVIPAGQTSATFTVQVNGDAMVEPDEKFVVWLSNATNGIVTDYVAIGTIINDDAPIVADAFEPNDAQESAADLGVIEGERTLSGLTIHHVGDQDWFEFQTTAKGSIRLDFRSAQGNVSLSLYDSNGRPTALRAGRHVVIPCEAGQAYYIKAVGVSGAVSSNYSFTIAAPTLGGTPTVSIGDGQARQVTYIDQDGTQVTITQKGGQAVLQFVGETVQQLPDDHGGIVISDEDGRVDLQEVSLSNTGPRSTLTFRTNKGGDGLAEDVTSYPLQRSAGDDDFVNLLATIKAITIKGLKSMPPEFLVSDSHFSAASIGAVTLRNADFASIGLYAADTGLGQEIKSVRHKNTQTRASWTWPKHSGADQDQIIHMMGME